MKRERERGEREREREKQFFFSFSGLKLSNEKHQLHILLRDCNPFTIGSIDSRRQGNHRGLGSIVQALISLKKLSVSDKKKKIYTSIAYLNY